MVDEDILLLQNRNKGEERREGEGRGGGGEVEGRGKCKRRGIEGYFLPAAIIECGKK